MFGNEAPVPKCHSGWQVHLLKCLPWTSADSLTVAQTLSASERMFCSLPGEHPVLSGGAFPLREDPLRDSNPPLQDSLPVPSQTIRIPQPQTQTDGINKCCFLQSLADWEQQMAEEPGPQRTAWTARMRWKLAPRGAVSCDTWKIQGCVSGEVVLIDCICRH